MASAETENFDYVIRNGSLGLIEGPKEEIAAQNFELVTNQGEWFLGPQFGYPWLVKNSYGENIGLLGTVFNSGYVSSVLGDRLLSSDAVESVESIELDFSGEVLTGKIREFLKPKALPGETVEPILKSVVFTFGGDL